MSSELSPPSYVFRCAFRGKRREELMRGLSARMRTRGPDGSGYHGNERFGLAHERLAIMDPEGGKQPIVYKSDGYSVCANGEIYNFRELQV